jgi:hypothetical protein
MRKFLTGVLTSTLLLSLAPAFAYGSDGASSSSSTAASSSVSSDDEQMTDEATDDSTDEESSSSDSSSSDSSSSSVSSANPLKTLPCRREEGKKRAECLLQTTAKTRGARRALIRDLNETVRSQRINRQSVRAEQLQKAKDAREQAKTVRDVLRRSPKELKLLQLKNAQEIRKACGTLTGSVLAGCIRSTRNSLHEDMK